MDKAAAEAKQIEGAQVEQITDNNGLKAVKVTFDSGILFTTGNASLSPAAKSALSKFANNVLNQNRDMDVSMDIPTIKDGETVRLNKVARKT